MTTDLQAGDTFDDDAPGLLTGLRVSGGSESAFDTELPFVAASTDGWDRLLADYRGRYLYLGVSKKF